jgi:putative nucleotidyltransferase with HDIG domain
VLVLESPSRFKTQAFKIKSPSMDPSYMPSTPAPDPRRFLFYLSALRELGSALALELRTAESARPLRASLYRVLGTFAIGRGALLLWDEAEGRLAPAAVKGLRASQAMTLPLPAAQARSLAAAVRPFHLQMPLGGQERLAELLTPLMTRGRLRWVVPLGTGAAFVGLLLLGERISGEPFSDVERGVMEEMAAVLALRIEDMRSRRRLAGQVRQLQRVNRQMQQIYFETVRALASVIDGPEPGGGNSHSVRVAALSVEIARRLGLSADRRQRLYVAALLHDLGKQLIRREILGKKGPLDKGERKAIEMHPTAGFELIGHLRFPWGDVAEIIRHHHERLDGKGYPDRLKGDQISLEAKILMMAEAFDAMTSDQPWRPRLSFEQVVRQIQDNLGLQFEPAIAQALCESVQAALEGKAEENEFVAHLEASFDPELIRTMLAELRQQLRNPTLRPKARIVELGGDSPA